MILKAALIIGYKASINQEIIELYNSNPNYLIIGNFKNGTNFFEIKSELKGKIDPETVITLAAHGSLDKGNHFLRLSSKERVPTSTLIDELQKCAIGPLQIYLDSCYSGNATSLMKGLKKESIMITNSKTDHPSMTVLSELKILAINHNPYISFFQSLHLHAFQYGKLATNHQIFEINPNYQILISTAKAKEFLENEAAKFIEFAQDQTWNNTKIAILPRSFSDEDVAIFSNGLFFHCAAISGSEFANFLRDNVESYAYLKGFINYPQKDGTTPLWISSQEDQYKIAKLLLELGADVNKAANNGDAPYT